MASVMSFSQYHKLFEAGEESNPTLSAADAILNAFFSVYGEIVPKIGDYKEAISDLKSLEREKELEAKGKKMTEIISKVSKKMQSPYSALSKDFDEIGSSLLKVWNELIKGEEGKKQVEGIQKSIETAIDSYIQNLISSAKDKNENITKPSEKKNESFNSEEEGVGLLLERIVWKEREQAGSDLATFKAELKTAIESQKGVEATRKFRATCSKALDQVEKFLNDLKDENFEKLKRFKKKEKLDEITSTITQLKEEVRKSQKEAFDNIGIETRVKNYLTELLSKVKEAQAKVEEMKMQAADQAGESEDSKEGDKSEGEEVKDTDKVKVEDFSDISVGGENSQKKGKNRESIKSWQVLYNTINPAKKIAEDGLFGRADKKRGETEDAVVFVANMMSKVLNKPEILDKTKNGTVLTPEVQALTKAFVDKVLPDMKSKLSSFVGNASTSKEKVPTETV